MVEWFDDLTLGMRFKSPEKLVTREDIKRFATEFDPQPYHLDDTAAERSVFGGLAASGWHTAAIAMGLAVETRPFGPTPSSVSGSTNCAGLLRCARAICSIWKATLSN
jgi:acyl dehydratase